MRPIIAALIMLTIVSCAGGGVRQDAGLYYKRTMRLQFAGRDSWGVLVLPQGRAEYQLTFWPENEELERWRASTCNRAWEDTEEDWISEEGVEMDYEPDMIEQEKYCPLEIEALSPVGSSFAFIDMADDKLELPFNVDCDGKAQLVRGVGVCQARAGTTQHIWSAQKIVVSGGSEDCEAAMTAGDKEAYIAARKGACVYSLMDRTAPRREGRLTILGYDAEIPK